MSGEKDAIEEACYEAYVSGVNDALARVRTLIAGVANQMTSTTEINAQLESIRKSLVDTG